MSRTLVRIALHGRRQHCYTRRQRVKLLRNGDSSPSDDFVIVDIIASFLCCDFDGNCTVDINVKNVCNINSKCAQRIDEDCKSNNYNIIMI